MSKFTFDEINSMYVDVLKEIGNIGAGNATTAVATMLNMKLRMEVPNVKLMAVQELNTAIGSEEEQIVGIYQSVGKDIEGSLMFLLKMNTAHYLVSRLMDDSRSMGKSLMKWIYPPLKRLEIFSQALMCLRCLQ